MQYELRGSGTVFISRLRRFFFGCHYYRFGGGVVVVGLLVGDRERRVLLLRDAHVVARVALLHDVPRARVQQDRVLVELR